MNTNSIGSGINNLIIFTTAAFGLQGSVPSTSNVTGNSTIFKSVAQVSSNSNSVAVSVKFTERKSYTEKYKAFAASPWFKKTYHGKSLGDNAFIEE